MASINKCHQKVKSQILNKSTMPIPSMASIGKNQSQLKPKQPQPPKVVPKYKRFTPSPFMTKDKQKLNRTVITSMAINEYNDQPKPPIQKQAKKMSVSRRENSWDKSITAISLNKSNRSIVNKSCFKNKILLNLGTRNLSKASVSYLDMNETGFGKAMKDESLRDSVISEIRQPTAYAYAYTDKKAKKAKPIGLKSKVLINPSIQPKVAFPLQKSETNGLKKQTNPLKKAIQQPKSDAKEERNKENTSTSFDSMITKETASKIKIFEAQTQTIQIDKKERVVKRVKCIHDLSKTGLTGSEKKLNQDAYFIFKNFSSHSDYIYMGVCDGHGLYGHEVSGYIRENLPMDLNHAIQEKRLNIITDDLSSLITQTFIRENYNLRKNSLIDSKLSGTTCASVIYTPEKMIIANLGDSRVVLGKEVKGEWRHENLSRDHKPAERDEAERILKVGGRIRPMLNEEGAFVGPPRVYMKEKDIPGLSMTRSFGDYFASTAGCISIPEVSEYLFQKEDRFMVIASDGLWEFLSSEEVVKIVQKYYVLDDIVGCCEGLYKESCKRWIDEEEEVIDDITMIIVFF